MSHISLFRKRKIWLPTLYGWVLILLLGAMTGFLFVRHIYSFLAQNEPVGAHILVVEGWLAPVELDQAVLAFKKGHYERVITTGGPIIKGFTASSLHSNYAKRAADYLAQHGVPHDVIIIVPTPASAQDRTFLSGVILRESVEKLGINLDAIDLFSSGTHSRRSRLMFQLALGAKVPVGILAARPVDYDPDVWWRSSSGAESIVFQSVGLLWVKLFFWPGAPGSQQELWTAS
jgi:uncharacterized SAM-binding protein YcdF (DUF218 family)